MAVTRWQRRMNMLKGSGPRRAQWAFGPVVLTTIASMAFGFSETSIRLSGLLLQILGLGGVVYGLNETRREFGLPAIHTEIVEWFDRFRRADPRYAEGDALMGSMTVMSARMSSPPPDLEPDATMEQRLKRLETYLSTSYLEARELERRVDREVATMHGKIAAERNLRESKLAELGGQLQRVSTGGVWISAIGSVWLFFGLIFGTASPEILDLIAG